MHRWSVTISFLPIHHWIQSKDSLSQPRISSLSLKLPNPHPFLDSIPVVIPYPLRSRCPHLILISKVSLGCRVRQKWGKGLTAHRLTWLDCPPSPMIYLKICWLIHPLIPPQKGMMPRATLRDWSCEDVVVELRLSLVFSLCWVAFDRD